MNALDRVGCGAGLALDQVRKDGRMGEKVHLGHSGDIQAVSVAIIYVSTNLTLKCEKKFTGAERFCFLRNVM